MQKFPYEVKVAAPEYHIVKNRHSTTMEDSMMVVKNRRTLDGFKHMYSTTDLEKQSKRKWELANAHDMRFESIDRDTTTLSSNKRCPSYVSLDKSRERDFSYLINHNMVCADYQINDKLVTRKYGGCVSLEKQSRRWD